MSNLDLYTDLATAIDGVEVNSVILSALSSDYSFKPVGRENNIGVIEVATGFDSALIETITNGIDANIALGLRNGKINKGCHPQESISKIVATQDSSNPNVSMLVDKTITVIDEGIGISGSNFGNTILSLNDNNKITETAYMGQMGMGGKAIFKFSSATVIASIHVDNLNEVAFTVVWKTFRSGWKTHSYVYMVDSEGNVPTIPVSSIPKKLLKRTNYFKNAQTLDANDFQGIVLPTQHGTTIKMFDVEAVIKDEQMPYYAVRLGLFGSNVNIGYYRTSKPDQSTGQLKSRKQNITGLSNILTKNTSHYKIVYNKEKVIWKEGNSKITAQLWVADATDKLPKNAWFKGSKRESSIYVTVNGQTHGVVPDGVLLKNLKLPRLANYYAMHIDCSYLNASERSKMFITTRENMSDYGKSILVDYIEEFLKSERKLYELEELFKKKELAQIKSTDTSDIVKNIIKFSKISSMMSSALGNFSINIPGGTAKQGRTSRSGDDNDGIGEDNFAPVDNPTFLVVDKEINIRPARTKNIIVKTDGADFLNEELIVESYPSFINFMDSSELVSGSKTFGFSASSDSKIGDMGTIVFKLKNLTVSCSITVCNTTKSTPSGNTNKRSFPNIVHASVEYNDQRINDPENPLPSNKVAYKYFDDGTNVIIYWNENFPSYVDGIRQVSKKNTNNAEIMKTDYLNFMTAAVLFEIDQRISDASIEVSNEAKAISASAHLFGIMQNILQ